jgi:membrane-associated phospholipid phosphatase
MMAATWLFAAITEVNRNEPLTTVDARISVYLHAHMTPRVTTLMLLVSRAHSTWGITIMTFAVFAYWWARRMRHWVATAALSVYGGMLLNVLMKNVFQRARPHFENPILTLTSYGFPSGHTMAATVFYGTMCAFVLSQTRRWHWRGLAISGAVFMIALVGFSRMYLGAHYLTYVLGAMVEGLVWVALTLTAVSLIRRRRRRNR